MRIKVKYIPSESVGKVEFKFGFYKHITKRILGFKEITGE